MHITKASQLVLAWALSNVALSLVVGVLVLHKTLVPEILIVHFVSRLLQVLHVRPTKQKYVVNYRPRVSS